MRRLRALLLALAVVVVGGAPSFAVFAAPGSDVDSKRADLDALKRRIDELDKSIAGVEAGRSAAERQRVQAERTVSAARRRMRDVVAELAQVEAELADKEAEQVRVAKRIEAGQGELGQWLRRNYVHGGSEVAPFLAAQDPNQIARDLHYLEHLGRARLALIERLRADLREQEGLVATVLARKETLRKLEIAQRRESEALAAVLAERSKVVASLSADLKKQRAELAELREDEEQLGRLLVVLARQQAEREAARRAEEARRAAEAARRAEIARRAAEAERIAAQQQSMGSGADREAPSRSVATDEAPQAVRSEPVVGQVTRAAELAPTGVSFAQLQGRMRFPVRGELVGRFGAPRAEGGTRWRGVFIRAGSGQDVVAVAPGEVVFADWLRGYGNLIIVDHGSEYMTIYGHNDALLREVGDRIDGGVAIASVGASGSVQESGLYFEIRHRGQPVDPMKWVRLN